MTKTPATEFELTAQGLVLRELIVSCHIGVTEQERAGAQRLLITLEAALSPRQPRQDRVEEVVDYGAVARAVREVCRTSQAHLLETLGGEIAGACLAEPRVRSLRLRIEKLDRYDDMAGIGVALEFTRSVDTPPPSADRG